MRDWRAYIRDHLSGLLKVEPEREHEILSELAQQLEQAYSDALAGRASEQEAEKHAEAQFADWSALASEINAAAKRHPSRSGLAHGIVSDFKYAIRLLRKSPTFALIAVFTLAIGMGGTTSMFTIVDAVALRSLPYRQPDRLVTIETHNIHQPEIEPWTSAPDFFDIRERARSFSAVAAISPVWNLVLTGDGDAQRLECLYVSASFFPLLGVQPALGRGFLPNEDNHTEKSHVIILSDSFWRRRFGGNRDAIGKVLDLDGSAYTVVGILPAGFRYAGEPIAGTTTDIDIWLPLADNSLITSGRYLRFLKMIGRLAPGVSVQQADDELRRIGIELAREYPDSNRGFVISGGSFTLQVSGRFRRPAFLLLGTVAFVLLLSCANVANLLLARASERQKEISVRIALGASLFRISRQLVTEGLVLALLGGAIGLVVANWILKIAISIGPASLMHTHEIALNIQAFLFTAATIVTCGILSGLPPAWQIVRSNLETMLRRSGRGLTAGDHRIRASLVVAQVAIAMVLLAGAGLLMRSFIRLVEVNPGFNAQNLVTISTQTPPAIRTASQRSAFYRDVKNKLLTLPGITSVAAVSRLPLMGSNISSWLTIEGRATTGQPPEIEYRIATPSYFSTMGIPLRRGRLFDDHDQSNAGAVVLINETMARKFWPNEDPIGKHIKLGAEPETQSWISIVGVVGDVRHFGLDIEPRPEVYRPYDYSPLFAPILVIRTQENPKPLLAALAAKVRSVNSGVPAYNVFLMESLIDRSTSERRFLMLMLMGFAAVALLIAAAGIYGVMAQLVVQRTQEIGVRIALGASPSKVIRVFLLDSLRWLGAGIVLGSIAAVGLTTLMKKLLFQVHPLDPLVFAGAIAMVGAFALLASYAPAYRASRVDPLIAIRQE